MIVAVVINHNLPENADLLFEALSYGFDHVELINGGSAPEKIPINVTIPLPNVYWEGAWLEAMSRWSDMDAIWVVGGDIGLVDPPISYRQAIEAAMPFGCWSPAIRGRAHPFMLAENSGERNRVKNVEGMALAVSGELIRTIGAKFHVSTEIGFGQDYWLCAMARGNSLPNYIDGTVSVLHPHAVGYNEGDAHAKMERAFTEKFGADFRRTLFDYSSDFEGNLMKETPMDDGVKLTVATVDNGWGVKDFDRIMANFPQCRTVIMRKGVSDFSSETSAKVIPYNENLAGVIDADIVFFPRIGAANRQEYEHLVDAHIPVLANVAFAGSKIIHEENGLVYGNDSWAIGWMKKLVEDSQLRQKLRGAAVVPVVPIAMAPVVESVPSSVVVSIITPTFKRDPRVVSRCLDCVRLQTLQDIEQLVCSDGSNEQEVATLVGSLGDARITYQHTEGKKPGDFGNVVRSEMLKKARGEFVLFLDDDNIILPHYLERMVRELRETPGTDFAVCRVVHFGPLKEDVLGAPPKVITGIPVKLHHVDPLQILVRREAMLDIGWDTERGYLADGVTLERLGDKYKYVEVPEVLGFHM